MIQLKTSEFNPRDAGQLGFSVAPVEGRPGESQLQPTIRMLLVADRHESVGLHAFAGNTQPAPASRYALTCATEFEIRASELR